MNTIPSPCLRCDQTGLLKAIARKPLAWIPALGLSLLILAPMIAIDASDRAGQFQQPEVKESAFPDRTTSILEFGAIGDGKTVNTQPFEKAMTSLSQQGGGKLIVP